MRATMGRGDDYGQSIGFHRGDRETDRAIMHRLKTITEERKNG
jgi:hypothetical protein